MVGKTVKASFPSDLERTVASALLLLSSSSAKIEDSCSHENAEFSATKSEGASSTAEEQPLTEVVFVPGYHDLKLKIVQKKRSKSIWISNIKKPKLDNPGPASFPASSDSMSDITATETSSSMSSSSSAQGASTETNSANKSTKVGIPGHMGRKASAILQILSNGCASEVRIRHLLGDSPSTSKALRMLLKLQQVKRSGAGGRSDPYIYMIA